MDVMTPKMMKPRRNWPRNIAPMTLKPLLPRPPYADEALPLCSSAAKSSQATIGATMKFSATWPMLQQMSSIVTPSEKAAPIIESMKKNAPPTIHGARLPKRECVLSESAPATMFEMAEMMLPVAANSASMATLCSASSSCKSAGRNRPSMTMYGPSQLAGPIISAGTRRLMEMTTF